MNWLTPAGTAAMLLLAACTQTLSLPPGAQVPWREQVDQVLADPALQGATVSLSVRDVTSGATLYQRNPDSLGVPASSLKLVTSAAAMAVLGADYRFVTQLASEGSVRNGQLQGDLYLSGSGDPTMTVADYRALAAQLAATGVHSVRGDLRLDDSALDHQRLGREWANDDESEPYAAQISALNVAVDEHYNLGSVRLDATARAGGLLAATMQPPNSYLQLVAEPGDGPLVIDRAHGSNRIDLRGGLAPGQTVQRWVSVWEPTGLVADVFRQALQAQGIALAGQVRVGIATPAAARVLAEHRSMPLQAMLAPLLKQSNNGIAEVLLKTLGRHAGQPGTADAGTVAVAGFLASQGIDPERLRQFDGSGLSRRNLLASRTFTDLLLAARQQPWFAAWYAALPIAGTGQRDTGGTLRTRLRGTPAQGNLHAKTGSMGAVSSLTGYLTTIDGRLLAFSMMSNNFLASPGRIKRLEDRVVGALLRSGD
jgi:D-alanyl-D-alanine carboxypeptidase/D-alanyl-D-alanine-endopeptidase (penicillin-binding protein 4)